VEELTETTPTTTMAVTETAESVPEVTEAAEPVPEVTETAEPVSEVTVAAEPVPEVTVTAEPVPEVTVTAEPVSEPAAAKATNSDAKPAASITTTKLTRIPAAAALTAAFSPPSVRISIDMPDGTNKRDIAPVSSAVLKLPEPRHYTDYNTAVTHILRASNLTKGQRTSELLYSMDSLTKKQRRSVLVGAKLKSLLAIKPDSAEQIAKAASELGDALQAAQDQDKPTIALSKYEDAVRRVLITSNEPAVLWWQVIHACMTFAWDMQHFNVDDMSEIAWNRAMIMLLRPNSEHAIALTLQHTDEILYAARISAERHLFRDEQLVQGGPILAYQEHRFLHQPGNTFTIRLHTGDGRGTVDGMPYLVLENQLPVDPKLCAADPESCNVDHSFSVQYDSPGVADALTLHSRYVRNKTQHYLRRVLQFNRTLSHPIAVRTLLRVLFVPYSLPAQEPTPLEDDATCTALALEIRKTLDHVDIQRPKNLPLTRSPPTNVKERQKLLTLMAQHVIARACKGAEQCSLLSMVPQVWEACRTALWDSKQPVSVSVSNGDPHFRWMYVVVYRLLQDLLWRGQKTHDSSFAGMLQTMRMSNVKTTLSLFPAREDSALEQMAMDAEPLFNIQCMETGGGRRDTCCYVAYDTDTEQFWDILTTKRSASLLFPAKLRLEYCLADGLHKLTVSHLPRWRVWPEDPDRAATDSFAWDVLLLMGIYTNSNQANGAVRPTVQLDIDEKLLENLRSNCTQELGAATLEKDKPQNTPQDTGNGGNDGNGGSTA